MLCLNGVAEVIVQGMLGRWLQGCVSWKFPTCITTRTLKAVTVSRCNAVRCAVAFDINILNLDTRTFTAHGVEWSCAGGAADNKQRAFMQTLMQEFLWATIGSADAKTSAIEWQRQARMGVLSKGSAAFQVFRASSVIL